MKGTGQGTQRARAAAAAAAEEEEECVHERMALLHGHMGPVHIARICNAGYDIVDKIFNSSKRRFPEDCHLPVALSQA
jgi:hypothetical protein